MYKLLCSNITKSHRSLTNFTGYYRKVAQKCNKSSPTTKKFTEPDAQTNQGLEETTEPIECSEDALEADTPTDNKVYTPFFTQNLGAGPSTSAGPARFFHTSHALSKCSDVAFKKPFKSREAERYYKIAIEQCLQIRSKLDRFHQQSNWAARPPSLTTAVDKELEQVDRRRKAEKPKQKPLKRLHEEKLVMAPELEKIAQLKNAKPTSQFRDTKMRITYPTHVARYKVGTTGYRLQHQVKQQVVQDDEVKTVYKDTVPEPLQSKVKHQISSEKERASLHQMRNKIRQKRMQQKCVEDNSEQAKQQKKYEKAMIQQHPTVRRANTSVKMAFKNRYNKLLQKSGLLYQAPYKSKEEEEAAAANDADLEETREEPPRLKPAPAHRDTGEEIFKSIGAHQEQLQDPMVTEHPMAITKQATADSSRSLKYPQRILSEKSESFDVDATCIKENTKSNATTTYGDYIAESEERVKNFVEIHKQEAKALLIKYKNRLNPARETPEATGEPKSNAGKEVTSADAIGEYLRKLKELRDQTAVDSVSIKRTEAPKQQEKTESKKMKGQAEQVGNSFKKEEPIKTVGEKVETKQDPHTFLDKDGAKKKQYPISDKFVVKKDVDSFIRKAVNAVKDTVIRRTRPKKPNPRSQSLENSRQEKTSTTRPASLNTARSENLFKKVQTKSAQLKTDTPPSPQSKNLRSKTSFNKIKARSQTRSADKPQENLHQSKKAPKEVEQPLKKIMDLYKVPLKGEVKVSMAEVKRINRRKRREREKRLKEETMLEQRKFDEEANSAMLKETQAARSQERERKYALSAAEVKTNDETKEGKQKDELERVTAAILQGIEKIALEELKRDAAKAQNAQGVAGKVQDQTEEHGSMIHLEKKEAESTRQNMDNQATHEDQTGPSAGDNSMKSKAISEKIIKDTELRLREVVEDNPMERTDRKHSALIVKQVRLEKASDGDTVQRRKEPPATRSEPAKTPLKLKIRKAKVKTQVLGKRKFPLSQKEGSDKKAVSTIIKEADKHVSRNISKGENKDRKDKERNKGKYMLVSSLKKSTDPVIAKPSHKEDLERAITKAADDSKNISKRARSVSPKKKDTQISKGGSEQINDKERGARKVYKLEDSLKNHINTSQEVNEQSILDADLKKSASFTFPESDPKDTQVRSQGKLYEEKKSTEANNVSAESAAPKEKGEKHNLKGKYLLKKFGNNIIKTDTTENSAERSSEGSQNKQKGEVVSEKDDLLTAKEENDVKECSEKHTDVRKPTGKYLLENIILQEPTAKENSRKETEKSESISQCKPQISVDVSGTKKENSGHFRINFDNVMEEIRKYIPDITRRKSTSNIVAERSKQVPPKAEDHQRKLFTEKNESWSKEISSKIVPPTNEYQSKKDLEKGSGKKSNESVSQQQEATLEKRTPEAVARCVQGENASELKQPSPKTIAQEKKPDVKASLLDTRKLSEEIPTHDKISKKGRYAADKLSKFQQQNIAKLREASTRIVKLVEKMDFSKTAPEKSAVPENRPTIRREPPPKSKEKPAKDKRNSKPEIVLPPKGRNDPKIQYAGANTLLEQPKKDIIEEITELISKAGLLPKRATKKSKSLPTLAEEEQKIKTPQGAKATWNDKEDNIENKNDTSSALGAKINKVTSRIGKEEGPRLIIKLRYNGLYLKKRTASSNRTTKSRSWQTVSQAEEAELQHPGGKSVNSSPKAQGTDAVEDIVAIKEIQVEPKPPKRDNSSLMHFRTTKRARIEDDFFRMDPRARTIQFSPKNVLGHSQHHSEFNFNQLKPIKIEYEGGETKTKQIPNQASEGDAQMDATNGRWRSNQDRAFHFQELRRGKIEDDARIIQTSRKVARDSQEKETNSDAIKVSSVISDRGSVGKEKFSKLKVKDLDAKMTKEKQTVSETELGRTSKESKTDLIIAKKSSSCRLADKDSKTDEKDNPKLRKDIERLIEVMRKADKELEEVLRVYEIFKKPPSHSNVAANAKQATNVEVRKEKSTKLEEITEPVPIKKTKSYELAKDSKSYVVVDVKTRKNADTKKTTIPEKKPSTPVGDKKNTKKQCKFGEKPVKPHKYLLTAGVQKEAKKLLKGKKDETKGSTTTKPTTAVGCTKKTPKRAAICHKDEKGSANTTKSSKTASKAGEPSKMTGKKNLLCSAKKKSAKLDCDTPKMKKDGSARGAKTKDNSNGKLSVQLTNGKGNKIVVTCGNYTPGGGPKDRDKLEEKKQKPVEIPGKRKTKLKAATHVNMPTDTPHQTPTPKQIARKQRSCDKRNATPKKSLNSAKIANKAITAALPYEEACEEYSAITLSDLEDSSKNAIQSTAGPKTKAEFSIMRSDLIDKFVKSKGRASNKEKPLRTIFVNKKIAKLDAKSSLKKQSKLATSLAKKRNVEDKKPKPDKAADAHLSGRRQRKKAKDKYKLGQARDRKNHLEQFKNTETKACSTKSITMLSNDDLRLIKLAQNAREGIFQTKHMLDKQLEVLETLPRLSVSLANLKENVLDNNRDTSNVEDATKIDQFYPCSTEIPSESQRSTSLEERTINKVLVENLGNEERFKDAFVGIKENIEVKNVGYKMSRRNMNSDSGDCRQETLDQIQTLYAKRKFEEISSNKLGGEEENETKQQLKEAVVRNAEEKTFKFSNNYLENAYKKVRHILSIVNDDKATEMGGENNELETLDKDDHNRRMDTEKLETEIERRNISWIGRDMGTNSEPILDLKLRGEDEGTKQEPKVDGKELGQVNWKSIVDFHEKHKIWGRRENQDIRTNVASIGNYDIPEHKETNQKLGEEHNKVRSSETQCFTRNACKSSTKLERTLKPTDLAKEKNKYKYTSQRIRQHLMGKKDNTETRNRGKIPWETRSEGASKTSLHLNKKQRSSSEGTKDKAERISESNYNIQKIKQSLSRKQESKAAMNTRIETTKKALEDTSKMVLHSTKKQKTSATQSGKYENVRDSPHKSASTTKHIEETKIGAGPAKDQVKGNEEVNLSPISGQSTGYKAPRNSDRDFRVLCEEIVAEEKLKRVFALYLSRKDYFRNMYSKNSDQNSTTSKPQRAGPTQNKCKVFRKQSILARIKKNALPTVPEIPPQRNPDDTDQNEAYKETKDETNMKFDESIAKNDENIRKTAVDSLKFPEELIQKLAPNKMYHKEEHKAKKGPEKARIEEICKKHYKEDEKIYKFNKNLIRHFQRSHEKAPQALQKQHLTLSTRALLHPRSLEVNETQKMLYNFLTMNKPFYDRSPAYSLFGKSEQWEGIVYYSNENEEKNQQKKGVTIYIEKSPKDRYKKENEETPLKPVNRACERICLPLKAISQIALKPSTEELTTLNKSQKGQILAVPKTIANVLDKYKGLKITYINVRRAGRKPPEGFLPTTKNNSEANALEKAYDPEKVKRQILEFRYELLRKLHKEFSALYEKDVNSNVGKFEKVSKYYQDVTKGLKSVGSDEVAVKPQLKSMEELLGPCSKPSFERVSRYYDIVMEKSMGEDGQEAEGANNGVESLVQKLPDSTRDVDRNRNNCEGEEVLAESTKEVRRDGKDPEDAGKRS